MNSLSELHSGLPWLASFDPEEIENSSDAPSVLIENLKGFGERLTQCLLAFEGIEEPSDGSQFRRLNSLINRGALPAQLLPFFYLLMEAKQKGHSSAAAEKQTVIVRKLSERLADWFLKTYGSYFKEAIGKTVGFDSALAAIRANPPADSIRQSARKEGYRRASTMQLGEDETRVIIDFQLRRAGWQADTWQVRYSLGARPEKGVNKAIAEWPTETGPADYALFVGLDFVGVVEAKKKEKDIVSDLGQGKRYSQGAQLDAQARFVGGPWGQYRVPFLFSTNSRPYLEQIKEKSGIWFLDVRAATNHPRPLQGWYNAEELLGLLKQDIAGAHHKLAQESLDYLDLRDYQKKAVGKIEESLEKGETRLLVAMATGTGKTKLAIALAYRMIKSGRFRRILFVVDRNALGEQADDKFKESRLEDLKTFDTIYELKELDEPIESTTKVKIQTVQSIMRAILYPSKLEEYPSAGQYDCIIVDEAHRGYTLDREMNEDELGFRDQTDYLSKYRRTIEYFDAVKIGLTATPAPQTVEIFGHPVFTYSYREAVIDGWLVDHEPPHQLVTLLAQNGIRWEKGDTIPLFDQATGGVTNLENIPDEVHLEIDHFNKLVVTKNFNQVIARELVKYLNPDGEEKTLVFAATDDHADMVVGCLKDAFEEAGVPLPDDAIMKITGSIDQPEAMIRRFKNERLPNIAVTVDLLTTGIDVHEICNLVFLRRVRSRILFEQMLGRATRRCDRIGKDHFNIFDAVALYEALEPISSMKAVAANPSATVAQLTAELEDFLNGNARPELIQSQKDQIVAKLRRILCHLEDDALEGWKTLSQGETLPQFIESLGHATPEQVHEKLSAKRNLMNFLDENRHRPSQQLISTHEDELQSHARGYGEAKKPEDYLNAFREFIILNLNKIPALAIVCQRPRELTRQTLKELKLVLDEAGFNEKNLQVAWRDWKNEEIAADIISFIRRQALGDPLISHKERIQNAMERIYALKPWTVIQRQWLERIEKQLIAQTILDREDFDQGAYAAQGGYNRLNKIFQGNFDQVLDEISRSLYPECA